MTVVSPLTDAQIAAIRVIQAESEQRAAPIALHLADVVHRLYDNNLSDTPSEQLRGVLDAEMKDLVWQALVVKR